MKGKSNTKILFVLGPSGAGKSTIGAWVAEDLHFLHIEIDRWPDGDGIDLAGIRPEWNAYWHRGSIKTLVRVLCSRAVQAGRSGTLLTFPGNMVLPVPLLAEARGAGVTVFALYGTGAQCLDAFLSREEITGRQLGIDHWTQNNRDAYLEFSRPDYALCRLTAFEGRGRRSRADIVSEFRERLY